MADHLLVVLLVLIYGVLEVVAELCHFLVESLIDSLLDDPAYHTLYLGREVVDLDWGIYSSLMLAKGMSYLLLPLGALASYMITTSRAS